VGQRLGHSEFYNSEWLRWHDWIGALGAGCDEFVADIVRVRVSVLYFDPCYGGVITASDIGLFWAAIGAGHDVGIPEKKKHPMKCEQDQTERSTRVSVSR
jgi:hypothetical protein